MPAVVLPALVLLVSAQDLFFDSAGVRIRYQVSGSGPAVVLLHGFGETLEIWQRAAVTDVLAPRYQVIAMDLRGHGASGKPHGPQSYGTELAADIVRLLRHRGLAQAHIVGYSMGALIALDFAILYPQHTRSVVLGGAGWNPPEAIGRFRQQADAFETGKAPVRPGDDPKSLAALLRGIRNLDEADLRRIKAPVAALIGSNDRFLPNVERLAAVLPQVRVVLIPEATHATALSHPKFGEALREFLARGGP